MGFRVRGLPREHFTHLFRLSDSELVRYRAVRRIAKHADGYPCRISLTDASPGQEVVLVHYEHHAVASPYASSFAIYVRAEEQTYDALNCVPNQLQRRMLAVRAYDAEAMLVDCGLTHGKELSACITQLLANPAASYLHVHYAMPGCYAARIDRA